METTTSYYEISRSLNGGGFKIIDTRASYTEAVLSVVTDARLQNPAQDPEYRISGELVHVCPGGQDDRTARRNSDGDRVKACVMCDTEWPYDKDEIEPHLAPEGRRPRIRVSHDPAACEHCASALRQARSKARQAGVRGAAVAYTLYDSGEGHEHHATWTTGVR